MKILLAVDGSECSKTAISEVAGRPWPKGSEVKVISVVMLSPYMAAEPWVASQNYFAEISRIEHEKAEGFVKSAVSELRPIEGKGLRLSSDVIDGAPKQVILDEAERWGADLIVLGSHGYGAVSRFLLGSVSQAVSLHAPCSVEIVRCRPVKESEKK